MKIPLIVLGAGGHAREVALTAHRTGKYTVVAYYVDSEVRSDCDCIDGIPVVNSIEGLVEERYKNIEIELINGVGDRVLAARWYARYSSRYRFAVLADPDSTIARTASLKAGAVIMAGGVISSNVTVGHNALIHFGSIVTHDCVISDGVFVGPGCRLCGGVHVGENAYLGAGVTVIPKVRICPAATVGAGAVVVTDVQDESVVAGVPAKAINNAGKV